MKKALSVFLTAAIIFSICVFSFPIQAEQKPIDSGYVGLGDSIARAYGNFEGDGYVDMLGNLLLDKAHAKNAVVQFKNLAQDGDRSDNLLLKLKNSPEFADVMRGCRLVSVSIGGNNIMQEMGRQVAVALGFRPDQQDEAMAYLNAHKASSATKILSHFNSSSFKNTMAGRISEVKADIPQIVKEIKKLSPNAQIVFQTLFCPTKFIFLSSFLDGYISDLNTVITQLSTVSPNNYSVIDIHDIFKKYKGDEALTYTDVLSGLFDPHPTKAGQKLIFDNYLPYMQTVINNLPERAKTPNYLSFENLRSSVKYGFDFDSSAFVAGSSIFSTSNNAKNYISVTGPSPAYDLKIVNNNHIKGLEFNMYQDYDCTPIKLKLDPAVCGKSFLTGTKTIPADSVDHGILMYVDTTKYSGNSHMLFQWEETDSSGSITRRGLKANSEAYMQDINGNFNLPVVINSNEYLMLPSNYAGYIAMPFNSFKTVWGTNDINFAVDLKNVDSFSIYRSSDAKGGTLMFDEFNFYGKGLNGDTYSPIMGTTPISGVPQNLVPIFNFEDNLFVENQAADSLSLYNKGFFSASELKNPPQYALDFIGYNKIPDSNSTKAMRFETLPAQAANGQQVCFGLNTRQDLGLYEKMTKTGSFVSSTSESDGVAFYVDLTDYSSPTPFEINVLWHETDCDGNGKPILSEQPGGIQVRQNTSRNLNENYLGNIEGVLDNGTSVSLDISGNNVVIPNLPSGERFKGWVKLPFAAYQTCWGSSDKNGAVDFYDIFGFNLYYSSYPSRTGKFILDEFSFYGPAFSKVLANSNSSYIPKADILDIKFNSNGTISDLSGNASLEKSGAVTVGNKSLSHKGTTYSIPAMTISSQGESVIANFSSVTTPEHQKDLYKYGFTLEAFGVNNNPSGEQAFISACQSGGYGLFTQNSGAKFIVNTNGNYTETFINDSLPSNELVHLAGVYDFLNKKLSVYKNGILISKTNISGDFTPCYGKAFNKVCLGADVDYYGLPSQSQMTNCSIVNAKIYSEPLNSNQIKVVYNNLIKSLN